MFRQLNSLLPDLVKTYWDNSEFHVTAAVGWEVGS